MRLLLYCDDPGIGGTASNATLLAQELNARGFDVSLAASTDLRDKNENIKYFHIDYDTQKYFSKTRLSRNEPEAIFLAAKPDIVLFNDSGITSSLAAKFVCREWQIPYVIQLNHIESSHTENEKLHAEIKQAYLQAVAVIAVSHQNMTLLRDTFAVPIARSSIIPNGRPDVFFSLVTSDERERLRQSMGLCLTDVLCLTVARYEKRKGYQYLLQAIAALSTYHLPVRLVFAWVGQSRGDEAFLLNQEVDRYGLRDWVRIVGEQKQIRPWYAMADIFVLPSESEGMPLCIIEAMAQSLPVVATAVSGIPEVLGDSGILLPDPVEHQKKMVACLAKALAWLATAPEERLRIGRAGRARALRHFTANEMACSYSKLLQILESFQKVSTLCYPDLEDYCPPHCIQFGNDIFLGNNVLSIEYIKDGWSHGEDFGRWTDGNEARLIFALPPHKGTMLIIQLSAKPFLGLNNTKMSVDIVFNNKHKALLQLSDPNVKVYEFALFDSNLLSKKLEITFLIHGCSSPLSHHLSDDARNLGLWLEKVRIDLGTHSQDIPQET